MNITVKQLQGGECRLEVVPTTKIYEIKQHIAAKLRIPIEEQTLLLSGRALLDGHTVDSYSNIKEGSKLNLVVKKPEGLFEASMKFFKKNGMSDLDARNSANKLLRIVEEKINKLSWDDLERLCLDCMLDEYEAPVSGSDQSENENDDDAFGL